MLRKELTSLSENGYNGPLFTHTLSNIGSEADGDWIRARTVTPSNITIDGVKMKITYLNSNRRFGGETTYLDVLSGSGSNVKSKLYYACFDRDKNYGGVAPYIAADTYVEYRWKDGDFLLNEDDVGKEVNVWLSTEPPPWV